MIARAAAEPAIPAVRCPIGPLLPHGAQSRRVQGQVSSNAPLTGDSGPPTSVCPWNEVGAGGPSALPRLLERANRGVAWELKWYCITPTWVAPPPSYDSPSQGTRRRGRNEACATKRDGRCEVSPIGFSWRVCTAPWCEERANCRDCDRPKPRGPRPWPSATDDLENVDRDVLLERPRDYSRAVSH